jgi:hypothetical protein
MKRAGGLDAQPEQLGATKRSNCIGPLSDGVLAIVAKGQKEDPPLEHRLFG